MEPSKLRSRKNLSISKTIFVCVFNVGYQTMSKGLVQAKDVRALPLSRVPNHKSGNWIGNSVCLNTLD